MLAEFLDFVCYHHMFSHDRPVLVAVSGGRDSVVLTHLMSRSGFPFAIAHCNFNLRPGDCDRDEAFVRRLASSLSVPIHVASFDTNGHAAAHKLSVEASARQLRYQFFSDVVADQGYCGVVTGHHQDDSIETFFINLLRGTGIDGLRGIRPVSVQSFGSGDDVRSLTVFRPLLPFSRSRIDDYVQQCQLEYVDDYTNDSLDFRRNQIRHQLLPLLRQMSSSADETIVRSMSHLASAAEVYHDCVRSLSARHLQVRDSHVFISFESVGSLHPQHALMYQLLHPFGFNAAQVSDILADLSRQPGSVFLSHTHRLVFAQDGLLVYPLDAASLPQPQISREILLPSQLSSFKVPSGQILLDADAVSEPLALRHPRVGDRFRPFGMKGASQLLSDYFKDHHVDTVARESQWLLVDSQDRILWLVGRRASHDCSVTPSTCRILRISISLD